MTEPYQLTLSQMAKALRTKSLTSEALVASCLERIHTVDHAVLAWARLDGEAALKRARQLDQTPYSGFLHGIPAAFARDEMIRARTPSPVPWWPTLTSPLMANSPP